MKTCSVRTRPQRIPFVFFSVHEAADPSPYSENCTQTLTRQFRRPRTASTKSVMQRSAFSTVNQVMSRNMMKDLFRDSRMLLKG